MVDVDAYVPILLTKRGERTAVKELSNVARSSMTPLFVVDPIAWDFGRDEEAKTVDEHLRSRPGELRETWGSGLAFLDLQFIESSHMAGGTHPLVWFTGEAKTLGLPLIPVTGLDRSSAYRAAAAAVAARDELGACLRLGIDDWPSVRPSEIDDLLRELKLDRDDVDLVLDLGEITGRALVERVVRAELATMPFLDDWRSVIVAGTGLPKTMPAGSGLHVIERAEWAMYRNLALHSPPPRLPTFADYAIAHPDPILEVNPAFMSIAATIRYTAAEDWLISKGDLFKGSGGRGLGGAAVPPAAARLTAHVGFTPGHCPGEDWMVGVAAGTSSPGGPELWRRWATLHHLELAPAQIATLHGP